jgi:hypothetical protein
MKWKWYSRKQYFLGIGLEGLRRNPKVSEYFVFRSTAGMGTTKIQVINVTI